MLRDVPHLFKRLRTNFMRAANIVWDGKVARWSNIVRLWELDWQLFRVHHLTKNHVHPKAKAKMRVKYAAQVSSQRTAGHMRTIAQMGNFGDDEYEIVGAGDTANVIADFDRLFDYSNGSHKCDDYRKEETHVPRQTKEFHSTMIVKEGSGHFEVWREMIEKLRRLKFWTRKKDEIYANGTRGDYVSRRPPFQTAYIRTLTALQLLWDGVKDSTDLTYGG